MLYRDLHRILLWLQTDQQDIVGTRKAQLIDQLEEGLISPQDLINWFFGDGDPTSVIDYHTTIQGYFEAHQEVDYDLSDLLDSLKNLPEPAWASCTPNEFSILLQRGLQAPRLSHSHNTLLMGRTNRSHQAPQQPETRPPLTSNRSMSPLNHGL